MKNWRDWRIFKTLDRADAHFAPHLERTTERMSNSRLAPVGRFLRNAAYVWNAVGGTVDSGMPPGSVPPPTGESDADRVWNRAAMEGGGSDGREGDVALTALLALHSVAMNGGLLHSVEQHTGDGARRAVAGFRYFGLDDAAEVVEWVERQGSAVDDPDEAERLEIEADRRYAAVVPGDATLVERFEAAYAARPEAFAPLR